MANAQTIPLPKGWPRVVRSGVLHTISLASTALSVAWGTGACSGEGSARAGWRPLSGGLPRYGEW